MIYKNLDGIIPAAGEAPEDCELLALVERITMVEMVEHFGELGFSFGIDAWMKAVFACNAYVDAQAPWALRKTDPPRMAAVLGTLVAAVEKLTVRSRPSFRTSAESCLPPYPRVKTVPDRAANAALPPP